MDSLRKPEDKTRDQKPRASPRPLVDYPNLPHGTESLPHRRNPRGGKALLFFVFFLFVFFLGAGGFVLYRAASTSHAIFLENPGGASFISSMKSLARSLLSSERQPLRGEKAGRVNILLLGRAGERYPGRNLTDTVMIASIDVTGKKVALLSLPRDLYVPIPETGFFTKLNSLYQYGLHQKAGPRPLRESVEEITGLPLHYFAVIDFDGFEKVVDALGGVRLKVERDIYDTRYPGKNYSYETFALKKGWQSLDGQTALKYVRERHDDPEGDFGRAKRQQQVMQALKDQAFSLSTFLNIFTIDRLLTTLGESVKTDMALEDIESLMLLSKHLDTQNTTTVVVDAWKKESLLRTAHVMVGETRVFILVPRVGNWSEIRDVAENIFRLDALAERKERLRKENARILILAPPEHSATAAKASAFLKQELGFTEIKVASLAGNTQLKNPARESIIVDMAGLRTPFSLDELMKRLPLQKKDLGSLSGELPRSAASSDIVILAGDALEAIFALEENVGREESFLESEALPPQPLSGIMNKE